ncbi:MAG: serine protease [Oscillospiraceae bacterium]
MQQYLLGRDAYQKFILRSYNGNSLTESCVDFPNIGYNIVTYSENSATDARCYLKYDYETGTSSTYWLTPSLSTTSIGSVAPNSETITRIVDGLDDRYSTTLPENTGIVKISCTNSEGTSTGTGFIVDNGVIATAAHVVDNVRYGDTLTITLHNSNGTLSTTTLTPAEVHIPYDYIVGNNQTKNDYALISVTEDLSNYPKFGIGNCYSLNLSVFSDIPIYVTGNPGTVYAGTDHEIDNTNNYNLYSSVGYVVPTNDESMFYFDTDATDGNSGGPVYTITKSVVNGNASYYYTALSTVHGDGGSSNRNCGVRFTKYHQKFYLGNSNIGFGS